MRRMEVYASAKEERMQALKFLEEKYDSRCGQLKFYPKLNRRKATQKDRCWKDIDGMEIVPEESSIMTPNESFFDDHSQYSSIQHLN
jgi:hypothetical protein